MRRKPTDLHQIIRQFVRLGADPPGHVVSLGRWQTQVGEDQVAVEHAARRRLQLAPLAAVRAERARVEAEAVRQLRGQQVLQHQQPPVRLLRQRQHEAEPAVQRRCRGRR